MIAVRGADIVGAASFNSRAGIPSRPVALLVFNSLSCWQAMISAFAYLHLHLHFIPSVKSFDITPTIKLQNQ